MTLLLPIITKYQLYYCGGVNHLFRNVFGPTVRLLITTETAFLLFAR